MEKAAPRVELTGGPAFRRRALRGAKHSAHGVDSVPPRQSALARSASRRDTDFRNQYRQHVGVDIAVSRSPYLLSARLFPGDKKHFETSNKNGLSPGGRAFGERNGYQCQLSAAPAGILVAQSCLA